MDEKELLKKAKEGDEKSLNEVMQQNKDLVSFVSRKFYFSTLDYADIVQEGMIGLFKDLRHYNLTSSASFKTFASVCIKRQIMSAITKNNRLKNLPLNTYLSINNQGKVLVKSSKTDDEDDDDAGFYVQATSLTPEESVIFKEKLLDLSNMIDKLLSPFEKEVLRQFVKCGDYAQIAKNLGKSAKSIDNALGRIKMKLREIKEN